jgi:hypothetical protein
MTLSPTFRTAFMAGLASPVGLYAGPAPYMAYASAYAPAYSFGCVASYLNAVAAEAVSGGQPEQRSFTFE